MVMPPLGLWYLAAQLEAQGHATDFRALDIDELPLDGDYDQLWISATSSQMFDVRRIGAITAGWTRTRTVFGGAAAWANPTSALELPFDVIVSGEADHPDSVRQIARGGQRLIQPAITPGPINWALPPNKERGNPFPLAPGGRGGKC